MIARDVMTTPVFFVSPQETVAYARNLMVKHKISRLLIMEDGRLVGILTKKDIAYKMRHGEPAWRRRPIDQIPLGAFATGNPVAVAPDTETKAIAKFFVKNDISSVPVVDEGTVIGIVTKSDLMTSRLLKHMGGTVKDAMEDVMIVNRYHSLDHIIDLMNERNDKLIVANNDGTIAGIITETNLAFLEPGARPGSEHKDVKFLRKEEPAGLKSHWYVMKVSTIAEDVMTSPVITTGPDVPLADAVEEMENKHINSLVVVENGTIMGIIKRDDILKEVAK
ncbi:MAG: CBS domain-containing protein [Methanoregula sp.]|jgi:CBS domain-containing protein